MNNPKITTLNQDPNQLKKMLLKIDSDIALFTKQMYDLQMVVTHLKQDRKVIQEYLSFGINDTKKDEISIPDYYYG